MQLLHFIVGLTVFLALSVFAEDRVMGWNKAHGLWGKRSVSGDASQNKRTPQNWNKLNSLWGKRSAQAEFDIDSADEPTESEGDVAMFMKRAQTAQWQRANGLWGR